jgi:hypothetical protein
MNKPKLNKYLSFTISNDKNLLDMLDSVQEIKEISKISNDKIFLKNKCKCCCKIIMNKFTEEHQVKCFQDKIEDLNIKLKLKEEEVKHNIHIKGLEILIEENNKKWNKLYFNK